MPLSSTGPISVKVARPLASAGNAGQSQRTAGPGERLPELLELQWSDGWSSRNRGLSCTSGEEAGYECRLGPSIRKNRLRHRSTLADQGREPERRIEPGVANNCQV